MYNLVKRQAEVEILPMAQSEGLGVITYSPLAGGLLSGKYNLSGAAANSRLLVDKSYQKRYEAAWVHETAGRFAEFALQRGFEPAALAVAWVGSHPGVTAPIIGARNLQQLEGSLKSLEIAMTSELRAEISDLSHAPASANDR
jgi:aryl-alcohol dehydrogenase-like predicted oxidoreductase